MTLAFLTVTDKDYAILVVGHLIMVKVFSKNVKSVTKAAADA